MQGTEKHTKVVTRDEKEFNAHHKYQIIDAKHGGWLCEVNFQKGAIAEHGVNGVHHEDLIAIVIDRLESFQASEFRCRENALAITKLEEALHRLRDRTDKREARGVVGTSKV